ncbi:hypothetical protein ACTA71_001279 [Dictyostelium dimigraforme]
MSMILNFIYSGNNNLVPLNSTGNTPINEERTLLNNKRNNIINNRHSNNGIKNRNNNNNSNHNIYHRNSNKPTKVVATITMVSKTETITTTLQFQQLIPPNINWVMIYNLIVKNFFECDTWASSTSITEKPYQIENQLKEVNKQQRQQQRSVSLLVPLFLNKSCSHQLQIEINIFQLDHFRQSFIATLKKSHAIVNSSSLK